MCIVLHFRVLFVHLLVYLLYPPVYLLPYLYSDATLVWLTVEPMWRNDNKVYQPILSKADLLSCLSTAMGLDHEPLLPNGVVNLQQYLYFVNRWKLSWTQSTKFYSYVPILWTVEEALFFWTELRKTWYCDRVDIS